MNAFKKKISFQWESLNRQNRKGKEINGNHKHPTVKIYNTYISILYIYIYIYIYIYYLLYHIYIYIYLCIYIKK